MQDNIFALPLRQPTEPGIVSKHTLAARLNPLIGREQEVAAICALLHQPHVRLLTLTGAGGIGKTRLAFEVAIQMRDRFADGVCFVSLAPIRDPRLMISTIAHELGIQEVGTQPLLEAVKSFLRDKQLLLLLDNFEQIVTAAPLLEDLLAACHQLTILVTSREVLHLQAEYLFPVPSLVLPDLTQLPDSEDLAQFPSVALFLQRAQAIIPDFQLTQDNAQAIAEICVRLDGLPLAIELAAARIKLLPPEALQARLAQSLRVLTGGWRSMPERQQTLRNTIAWSFDLLPAQEQRLFRWLSVFVGGCTLQAVDALNSLLGDGVRSLLDEVASLIDKSLLQQYELEGEPRMRFLETIHEYGRECLTESGEIEAVQQAHATYYLQLAQEAEPEYGTPEHAAWLKRLEREHDNLRAALRYLLEQGEREHNMELALRLGGALREFWAGREQLIEGHSFLMQALERSTDVVSPARAKALIAAAHLAIDQGNLDQGEELAKQGQILYQALGDAQGQALSLHQLQIVSRLKGDYRTARFLAEEALSLFQGIGDQKNAAWSHFRLARLARAQGEYARACSLFEENVAMHRELGNKEGMSFALNQGDIATACMLAEEQAELGRDYADQEYVAEALFLLGKAAAARRDYANAYVQYEESLTLFRGMGYKMQSAYCLEGLARVVSAQGDHPRAVRFWGAAEALREAIGSPLPPIERADYEQAVTVARGQLGEQIFAAIWAVGRTMTMEQVLVASGPVITPTPNHIDSVSATHEKSPTFPAGLTAREVEVLRLVAHGLSNAQVAEQLDISPRTVNWHLTSIYSKIQVSTRSAATRYVVEHHLV
jgi:predicted ATPase/DNA-binding CsgD family transcriptional regulator